MKSIPSRLTAASLCLLALSFAVYQAGAGRTAVAPETPNAPAPKDNRTDTLAPSFLIGPYLQFPTRTSITIMWETDRPANSTVAYGLTGQLSSKTTRPERTTMHEVVLSNLQSNTAYFYRVSSSDDAGHTLNSPILTFTTAVDDDSAFTFALIGDTQRNPSVTAKIARLIWDRRPHFVVHLGDVVNDGPDKGQWVHDLFSPCADLFARVAVLPTIGNHEKNHPYYYQYFALPEPKYYYRYHYGNADFFVVDSNKSLAADSEQYRWLDRELARSEATWKFVYHHHPAFSSDEDDYGDTWKGTKPLTRGDTNVRSLTALYEKHQVDMEFNGHVHAYERSWPIRQGKVDARRGVVYLTSGGGGGSLENAGPVPTWFKAEFRRDFHFCTVSIQGRRLYLKAIDHNGVLFDTFSRRK